MTRITKIWHRERLSNRSGKNGARRLAQHRAAANFQFVKNIIFGKHTKVRYACISAVLFFFIAEMILFISVLQTEFTAYFPTDGLGFPTDGLGVSITCDLEPCSEAPRMYAGSTQD